MTYASFNECFGLGSHSAPSTSELMLPMQDDAASTTVVDYSGNGNHGTLTDAGNTEDISTTGPNNYLTKAFALDGVNDQVLGTMNNVVEPYTFGLWVKWDGGGSPHGAMALGPSGSGPQLLWTSTTNLRAGQWGVGTAGSADQTNSSTDWQLIGTRYPNGDDYIELLVNGSHVATGSALTGYAGSTGIYSVGSIQQRLYDFPGDVAGAFAYLEVLDDSTWLQIYNGPEPINSVAPGISGTETEDETLTATSGTWGLDSPFASGTNGTITYSYQWTRSNDGSGTGEADIGGATSSTYTLVTADVGKYIRCRVRATNDGGYDADADTASSFTGAIAAAGGGGTVVPVFFNHYQKLRRA